MDFMVRSTPFMSSPLRRISLFMRKTRTAAISGRDLHHINLWEAVFLREEVKGYVAHGIQLQAGATVVDVGANIGVFSAYVHELLGGDAWVFAFEPVPPIFAVLDRNVKDRFGERVTALPYGLSSREDEVEFTYFPAATLLSSSWRNRENIESERERIGGGIAQWIRQGGAGPVLRRVPASTVRRIVERSLRKLNKMETHRVRVRPLSAVIDELGIAVIDLLKIDVEGAEVDVLSGIAKRHWPMVRQAVVEVEGWETNHQRIREIFESRRFQVHAQQDSSQEAADIGMIYAVGASDRFEICPEVQLTRITQPGPERVALLRDDISPTVEVPRSVAGDGVGGT